MNSVTKWLYASWGVISDKPNYIAKIRIDGKVSPAFDNHSIGEVQNHAHFRLIRNTIQSKIGSRRRFLKVMVWERDYEGNWTRVHDLSRVFTQSYQKIPYLANQLSDEDFTEDNELEMHWVELGLAQMYADTPDSRPPSSMEQVLNAPVRPGQEYDSYRERYMANLHNENWITRWSRQQQQPQQMRQPPSTEAYNYQQYQRQEQLRQQMRPMHSMSQPPSQRVVPHQIQARCPDCGLDPSTFTETGANSNYYRCNSCNQRHYVDSLLSSS